MLDQKYSNWDSYIFVSKRFYSYKTTFLYYLFSLKDFIAKIFVIIGEINYKSLVRDII